MMNKTIWIALAVSALDQAIKAFVRTFSVGDIIFAVPGIIEFTHQVNTGAAFSVLSGQSVFLAIVSASMLAVMYMYARSRMHLTPMSCVVLGCLIGGGVGNLADRMLLSGVTDYIRLLFISFPVFNFADIMITGSICVLVILLFTDKLEENTRETNGSDD